ncbi:6-hydroxymethylpterin diphosphokinase MptE-like protein [Flavobacterium sp. 3-218]
MMLIKKIKSYVKNYFTSSHINKENQIFKTKFGNYKQAVILGSGPSISKFDLKKFKDDFIITMGNFYEHPEINEINPNIHVFAASHYPITRTVLRSWWERCNEVLPKETWLLVEKRDKDIAIEAFKDRNVYFYSYGGKLPVDLTKKIMSPWSVTVVGLQLAIYCKVPKIILLGINHDWQCIHPYTHFYDHNKPSLEYYLKSEGIKISYEEQKLPFPKERLYKEYELYQQYESLKVEAKALGLEVYNGDPFSYFDVFPFEKRFDIVVENNQ